MSKELIDVCIIFATYNYTYKIYSAIIGQHGTTIIEAMYHRLFEDPQIEALFNQANQKNGTQIHALAGAILAYTRNIDNPGVLASAIERISQKHVGYAIHPEHYPHVATALLGAIKQVLGDVATSEVLEAWGEAYWFIANLLKDREAVIGGDHDQKRWVDPLAAFCHFQAYS